MSRPVLLGHRGLRLGTGPAENTVRAFDAALEAGCDGFEFDVRLTADAIPVICHDPGHAGRTVAACTAHELSLPTLDAVLARYASHAFLDVELKVPGMETNVARSLADSGVPEQNLVVSSFLPQVLTGLHSVDDKVPLGFIFDEPDGLSLWPTLPIRYVVPHHSLVTRELIADVHSKALLLFTWTVNLPADMLRVAEWGVDGIISDDPALLVRTLRERSRPSAE